MALEPTEKQLESISLGVLAPAVTGVEMAGREHCERLWALIRYMVLSEVERRLAAIPPTSRFGLFETDRDVGRAEGLENATGAVRSMRGER